MKTKDMVYIALFAIIIAICSWISIPSVVPFTLQTFAVFITVYLLGGKNSLFAILLYILLGAVGLPVFAGFKGGIAALFGATGGYIIGFVFIAIIYWLIEKFTANNLVLKIAAMLAGLIVCYAFGTAWFMHIYLQAGKEISLATALSWCVIPFIIPDLIKLALGVVLGIRLKPLMK